MTIADIQEHDKKVL